MNFGYFLQHSLCVSAFDNDDQKFQNFCHKTWVHIICFYFHFWLVVCFFFFQILEDFWLRFLERWLLCTFTTLLVCLRIWQPWPEILFCCVSITHRNIFIIFFYFHFWYLKYVFFQFLEDFDSVLLAWVTLIFGNISERWLFVYFYSTPCVSLHDDHDRKSHFAVWIYSTDLLFWSPSRKPRCLCVAWQRSPGWSHRDWGQTLPPLPPPLPSRPVFFF